MIDWFTSKHQVKISPSIVIFATLFWGGMYALYYLRSIVVMLFLAVIIMAALNPSVSKLERKFKVPRVLGILIMYLLWIAVLVLAFSFIIPPLMLQMQNLIKFISNMFPIQDQFQANSYSLTDLNNFASQLQGSVGTVLAIIISTFSGILTVFTVTVMSFYMLIDREHLHKKVAWFTRDQRHIKMAEDFINSVEVQLGGWVRAQLILMIVIGVVTYVGLRLLGVPYALPLALLAGLLEILPNLGPTIAAVPAVILAAVSLSPLMAGATVLFYIVVQQLENHIIVPKVMKDNVDVNPLTTIVTILIGLQVAGVIGALLAVPAYIIFRNAFSLWLKENS